MKNGINPPDSTAANTRKFMDHRKNLLHTVRLERSDFIPMTFHINDACRHYYPAGALQELMGSHPLLFPDFEKTPPPAVMEYPPYARADEKFMDPWGCLWQTSEDGIIGVVIRHPLESWNRFKEFSPPDPEKTTHWGPIDWQNAAEHTYNAISQKFLKSGEIGHNHTWLKLIDIRGYENVLFDMADEEPHLYELLKMLEDFNMGLVRNYIDRVGVEWMSFAEDLGTQTGPMLSPKYFKKYIKPSYQRLMKTALDAGCIVHVHADGNIHEFADDLLDCGVNVLNLQDLVNGIDWIAENLKGKVCIELDIDRQDITFSGTPQQIDRLIYEEVSKLGSRQGGLMMIYGLYPGVPLENAKAVMDAMEKYSTFYS